MRYLGEFPTTEAATRKQVGKLAAKYGRLTFCYEAGPTGYGHYRLITSLGHECQVAAPSLTPKKPGDHVKTNRRDAVSLARLSRAGELTAVWVPDERHEAMRDLSRARQAAKKDLQSKRRQISSLMPRLGRYYPGKKTWGPAHMKWLRSQKLEHREQRMALEELLQGVRQESERVERLEQAIREAVPEWSLGKLVTPCRPCAGLISLQPLRSWPRPVISPDFKTRASLWVIWALCPQKAPPGTRSNAAVSLRLAMLGHDTS